MKFFIDTANLEQIKEAQALGVLDGVTTNPSLMAKEGITGEKNILQHYVDICNAVTGDVSAEVIATDYDGIINEGETFLGASGKGLFGTKSKTFFIHNNSNMRLNSNNEIIFNFTAGQTFVDFEHDAYLKDTTITTSEYMLGLASENKDYNIKNFIGIKHPLSIVDGSLELYTISGYDKNGDYRNRKQEIDLSSSNNLLMIWNVDKFFDNNSLVSFKTSFNEKSSNLTGVYVFKF